MTPCHVRHICCCQRGEGGREVDSTAQEELRVGWEGQKGVEITLQCDGSRPAERRVEKGRGAEEPRRGKKRTLINERRGRRDENRDGRARAERRVGWRSLYSF